jgi:hypothetical protein
VSDRYRRQVFKDRMWIVFWVLIVAAVIGTLCWIIYADIDGYRSQCHNAGGHIVDIHDTEICVDRDNRVILI